MSKAPRMSRSHFSRLHPGMEVEVANWCGKFGFLVSATDGANRFFARGRTEESAIAKLSANILAYNGRVKAAEQGFSDANTGEIKPLEMHHLQHRAHSGTHEPSNLAGISRQTHKLQHE